MRAAKHFARLQIAKLRSFDASGVSNSVDKKYEAASKVDTTKKLLDISAEKNRNLLIAFMAYLATATILCLSITDLDLLIGSKTIELPLLSVGLPLWAFYTVIPLILLLLHFDVLHNIQEHRLKLNDWLTSLPDQDRAGAGNSLFPYIYDFAQLRYGRIENPTWNARLVAVACWLLYVYFPILVLSIFFIRFADLQGLASSLFHLVLVAVDIIFIVIFWAKVRSVELTPISSSKWLALSVIAFQTVALAWVFVLWLVIQVLHFFPASDASSWLTRTVQFAIDEERRLQKNFGESIAIVPRITVPYARPYQVTDDHIRLEKWLDPSAKEIDLWQTSFRPMSLKGRRLAFADLSHAQLRRVDFREADMQSIDLEGAELQDADFRYSSLLRATLLGANLQGADLYFARLQVAAMYGVKLQGAELSGARLAGAHLSGTSMRGANLQYANLQDTNFEGVDLRGAFLEGVNAAGTIWPSEKSVYKGLFVDGLIEQSPYINPFKNETPRRIGVRLWPPIKRSAFPSDAVDLDQKFLFDSLLALLCNDIYSHSGMLKWQRILRSNKEKVLAYINEQSQCVSYRQVSVNILNVNFPRLAFLQELSIPP